LLAAAFVVGGGILGPSAWGAGTGYLFVSSEKDNSVLVLDGSSYAVVKEIATAARPRHLGFSPDRRTIYAACGDGDAIDLIDVASLELVDRISGIDDPEAFDLSPDGRTLYVSLEDDAALGILDLETYFAGRGEKPSLDVAEPDSDDNRDEYAEAAAEEGEEGAGEESGVPGLSRIEVGAEPEAVLAHPQGNPVWVASEVANLVHVVDVERGEIAANVLVGNRPRRFALTPDHKELWVSNELGGSVSIIDTASNKVIGDIVFTPKGFRPEDVTPVGLTLTRDGQTLVVGLGRANHVAFVDVSSREIQDYVLVGNRAWNTRLSRDESTLYVVNGLSDDISILDMASRKVLRSIPVGRVPYMILIDD
jgi:YVTN family beta-propeller protein